MDINKMKVEIWEAQNQVYLSQTLYGDIDIEIVLGKVRKARIECLMDKLDVINEIY